MKYAWLLGGSVPYQEAVRARLETAGLTVIEGIDGASDPQQTIVLGYCSGEADWAQLEGLSGYLGCTAVIERIEIELYVRALKAGLGVVHVDTRSETIVSVAIAAGAGEAVLPREIARQLAETQTDPSLAEPHDLDPLELDIVRSVARGETLASIASRYFYSERTLRRRLHSACIKLGVQDRSGAIKAADRRGLLK